MNALSFNTHGDWWYTTSIWDSDMALTVQCHGGYDTRVGLVDKHSCMKEQISYECFKQDTAAPWIGTVPKCECNEVGISLASYAHPGLLLELLHQEALCSMHIRGKIHKQTLISQQCPAQSGNWWLKDSPERWLAIAPPHLGIVSQ